MNVILASQSPRRRELLGLFHIPFCVRVADIDETMTPGAAPDSEVARLSREKALAVERQADDLVIDEVNLIHSELTGSFRVVSLPAYMEVCLKDRNIMK